MIGIVAVGMLVAGIVAHGGVAVAVENALVIEKHFADMYFVAHTGSAAQTAVDVGDYVAYTAAADNWAAAVDDSFAGDGAETDFGSAVAV